MWELFTGSNEIVLRIVPDRSTHFKIEGRFCDVGASHCESEVGLNTEQWPSSHLGASAAHKTYEVFLEIIQRIVK
jgi:hypothetical protein